MKSNESKKILFVINTMGHAGAEMSLLDFLKRVSDCGHEIYLYVLMGQGELANQIPPCVKLLNKNYSKCSVLTGPGRIRMTGTVLRAFLHSRRKSANMYYLLKNLAIMIKKRDIRLSRLLWRIVSDGADPPDKDFDLAVAWLEGGSAYFVADHVKARRKCALIHTDYKYAGYTRQTDLDCWENFQRIFLVSDAAREHFLKVYPEYASKAAVFDSALDPETIRMLAGEQGGFSDGYTGFRLLTVGRLVYEKAYDIAVDAMKLLKDSGWQARWYVLGEGPERKRLKKRIAAYGLEKDFVLMGEAANPYPYYAQADIYVHASRYEGRSLALWEAQMLGCAVIASDCEGNREQIRDGVDGLLCDLTPRAVAESIAYLLRDKEKRRELGRMAESRKRPKEQELWKLLEQLM